MYPDPFALVGVLPPEAVVKKPSQKTEDTGDFDIELDSTLPGMISPSECSSRACRVLGDASVGSSRGTVGSTRRRPDDEDFEVCSTMANAGDVERARRGSLIARTLSRRLTGLLSKPQDTEHERVVTLPSRSSLDSDEPPNVQHHENSPQFQSAGSSGDQHRFNQGSGGTENDAHRSVVEDERGSPSPPRMRHDLSSSSLRANAGDLPDVSSFSSSSVGIRNGPSAVGSTGADDVERGGYKPAIENMSVCSSTKANAGDVFRIRRP